MFVKAGELNQRIIFEAPTTTLNDLNEPIGGWVEGFRAWAKVRPVRARDVVEADHPYSAGTYIFTVRSSAANALTATSGHRIAWGRGLYYPVGEPMHLDGLKGFLMITASSVKVNDV